MEAIKVNLIPNGIPEACHASQYDEGRQIRLDLFDGLTPYTIQAGDTFTLNVRKPDNHIITQTVTGTEGNTYLVIDTTEQMTAVTGENLCEIRLENGGDNIGSLNFIMQVEKDVIANGIPSESVIEDLEALVVEAVGDNYYTKSEVDALIEGVEDNTHIVDEASGSIARFNTDLTENLLSAVAEFSASQASGTPTPVAPIPIVGVDKVNVTLCGKNMLDKSTIVQGALRGNDGGVDTSSTTRVTTDFIEVFGGNTYITSIESGKKFVAYHLYDKDKNSISQNLTTNPITAYQSAKYIRIAFGYDDNSTIIPSDVSSAQFELGNQSTTYEAYNGTTALINLGGTYYGGSVDVVSGKITLTFAEEDLGNKTWAYDNNNQRFQTTISGIKRMTNNGEVPKTLCSIYQAISISDFDNISKPNYKIRGNVANDVIFIRNTDYTDGNVFKTAMNGVKIYYELATPIVVYASNTAEIPTINGFNQVFADTGDVAVKYKKSVKAYIDDKLKAIFVSYDNSNSGLTASNTQAAIDELAGANRSVNPLRTSAPVEELETRDEPETDEPETRGDDNEER